MLLGKFDETGRYTNRITELFGIDYPIIQAGMIWASGWELAGAVSNAGGLGLIGAGSMYPEILEQHILRCREVTDKPFGVNLPLLYPKLEEHIRLIIKYKVPIVFTSAGNPKTWTSVLKSEGIKVVHVVSSSKFALKSQDAGVDAVVAEGFEAGGHNGREETTTLCLIPEVRKNLEIPLLAAGGIGGGRAMLACMALGAEGVQIGSRYVCSKEASCHVAFKQEVVKAKEGDTRLVLKDLTPVRLLKNKFYDEVISLESAGAGKDRLADLLGKGRARKGMFDGNMEEGELEIGQVSSQINTIQPAGEITREIWLEFKETLGSFFELAKGKT